MPEGLVPVVVGLAVVGVIIACVLWLIQNPVFPLLAIAVIVAIVAAMRGLRRSRNRV